MFEQSRAWARTQVDARRVAVDEATGVRDDARSLRDTLHAALATAQAAVPGAQAELDQAQGATAAAQATRDAAQGRFDDADRRYTDWLDDEPERTLPNGKPNPAWPTWRTTLEKLASERAARRTELTDAAAALTAASGVRDAAAARLAAAQNAVAQQQMFVAEAEDGLTRAESARTAATDELDRATAVLDAFDAREARILADPPDRDDLAEAADAETAAALALRRERYGRWTHRLEIRADREATFAAHDTTAADLATLAATIRAWPGAAADPGLSALATALEQLAAEDSFQSRFPADARSDDLENAGGVLDTQLQAINGLLGTATGQRSDAAKALSDAAAELDKVNKEAPKK